MVAQKQDTALTLDCKVECQKNFRFLILYAKFRIFRLFVCFVL